MKFKKGDRLKCINAEDSSTAPLTLGKIYTALEDSGDCGVKIMCDEGIPSFRYTTRFKLVSKNEKPKKNPHTETDRRKAAKAVRELQKKLEKAIAKAVETGINVSDCTEIEMTYQPATPKMRKY